jgi:hypothetical protein
MMLSCKRIQRERARGDDPRRQLTNVIESIVLRMTTRSRLMALENEDRYLSPENRQRYRPVHKGVEELALDDASPVHHVSDDSAVVPPGRETGPGGSGQEVCRNRFEHCGMHAWNATAPV